MVALIATGLSLAIAGSAAFAIASNGRSTKLAAADFSWPAGETAALSFDSTIVASPDADATRPIAGLTKLVTALVVLDTAPLAQGAMGPSFAMGERDVLFERAEVDRGGTTVPVDAGDVLTERQLLELVLVASSNNHAASLVTQVFGDEGAYLIAARRWLDEHDLPDVRIADASGMSAGSRASTLDLLEIGRRAAADPVIAEITALSAVITPRGEIRTNTNDLLGTLGITGLKAADAADVGYAVLFRTVVGDQEMVGVLLGASSRAQRATDVTRLIARARALLDE